MPEYKIRGAGDVRRVVDPATGAEIGTIHRHERIVETLTLSETRGSYRKRVAVFWSARDAGGDIIFRDDKRRVMLSAMKSWRDPSLWTSPHYARRPAPQPNPETSTKEAPCP